MDNLGPEDVIGATVEDLIPPTVNNASWTCVPSGGASCIASGELPVDRNLENNTATDRDPVGLYFDSLEARENE